MRLVNKYLVGKSETFQLLVNLVMFFVGFIIFLCAFLLIVGMTGFNNQTISLKDLRSADNIEILTYSGTNTLKTVSDSEVIKQISSFFEKEETGWKYESGVRPGDVTLNFYQGKVLIKSIGIGGNYLTTDITRYKWITQEQSELILSLVKI